MPTEQIPIGVTLPVLSGVVYATPSVPCTLTTPGSLQSAPAFEGPFASFTSGNLINRGFIKPSGNTTVNLTKLNTFNKDSASYLSPYARQIILDGASNFWRLGESSGLVAVDSVGGANGTISGGVTLGAAGAIADGNKAMTFDGATGKIVTAASATLPSTFTCEAWLKTTGTENRWFFSTRLSPSTSQLAIGVDQGKLVFWDGFIVPGSFRLINDGQWHHAIWVFEGSARNMYIDGLLDRTSISTAPWPAYTGPVSLGYDEPAAAANRYWSGPLDDVAIYPRALSSAEIATHYSLRLRS